MRLKTWKSVSFFVILTNLLVLFYMLSRLDTKCKCSQKSDENYYDRFFKGTGSGTKLFDSDSFKWRSENVSTRSLIKAIEDSVTLIVREFEYFENDIPETLYTFLEIIPNITVLIITDTKPYPPMNFDKLKELQLKNLRLINLKGNPTKSVSRTQPENFIKTKYVLFWPDSVRLSSALQLSKLIGHFEDSNSKIVAAKVAGAKGKCLNAEVDLLKWTLTVEYAKKPNRNCNYLEGNYVVLMPFEVLQELSHPWSRPFPNTQLIQTSLRSLKIQLADKVLFLSGKPLFTDAHSQWKRDSFWNARRSNFFNDFGIKKVTDENGDVTWYGCAKTSQRCFGTIVNDMPEYLYENRWTPPCCLEHLRETTRHVVRILEKCGVRYWLEGGSLLGAARYEDIIPWDYDVDIGIYKDDIPKCEWLKNAQKQSIVDTKGFVWEKASEGDFFRVQYSATNHLHVDLFPFYSKDGVMTKDTWFMTHKQDTEFPEHFLMPLITIKFVGIYVAAPNNVRDFLELKFGKNVIEKPEYPSPKLLKFPFSK